MKKVRSLLFTLLAAVCVVCVAVAFSACGSKEKSGSYGAGEEGFYYYDGANSERYMLSLQSGKYMITANGETAYSGSYSYNEESGEISFTSGDDKFTATVGENALSLDMTGSGYSFKAYKYFDVTYVDENGETIATKSVLNGQSAEELEIEKDGYWFIGWYEDSTNSSEFAFNTSIAGDTFVYGWYIEKNPQATEYVITLDFGDGESEVWNTTNGAVYKSLPEVNGSKENILGWWVSATNDSGELTYKYSIGDVFTSDTTLFAVYGGIGASVTKEGITWDSSRAGANVSIEITSESGETVLTANPSSSSGSYTSSDFTALGTGVYTVAVGSDTLTYVVNGLDRVSKSSMDIIENGEGRIISFAPVENASGYMVTIDDGEKSVTEDLGSRTYYNLSSWEMTKEGLTITITAYADGFVSSVSDEYSYLLKLEKVTLEMSGDDFVWNRVEGALEYEVKIYGEDGDVLESFYTTETSYSLKYYDAGTYTISVKPVTSGYWSEESFIYGQAKNTIAAPVICDITSYTVTWTEVDGAVSYVVMINGTEYAVTDGTTLNFSEKNVPDASSYEISVMAVADSAKGLDSSYSDTITATNKEFKSSVRYEKNTVYWDYDVSATSYVVSVNGTETTIENGNSAEITLNKAGNNKIIVTAYSGGESLGQAEIDVYAYAVILDPNGATFENGTSTSTTIYVAQGDVLNLGEVTKDHANFVSWYTQADYTDGQSDVYEGKGSEVTNGTIFTGSRDMYLYAYWSYEYLTVNLYLDANTLYDTVEVKYNSTGVAFPVIDSTEPENAFAGWYTQVGGSGTQYTSFDGIYTGSGYGECYALYAYFMAILNYQKTTYSGQTVYAVSANTKVNINMFSEITIPESYENCDLILSSGSFQNLYYLEIINIPDTVRYIAVTNDGYRSGTGAFAGCSALREVNIYATGDGPDSAKEVAYFSDEGVLFHIISTSETGEVELLYYPYAKQIEADSEKGIEAGEYIIPSTVSNEYECVSEADETVVEHAVTTLPAQVFRDRQITKVFIPNTVTSVEAGAFYNNSKLTSVVFEDGGSGELKIADRAFRDCTAIEEVTISSRITTFNPNAFVDCTSLTNIIVTENNTLYSSENGILLNKDGDTLIYYPLGLSGVIDTGALTSVPGKITKIGESAFASNIKITSVTISGSVTEIGKSAFEGCMALSSLTFSGTANSQPLTIKERAFYDCVILRELVLPVNLGEVEKDAFGGCANLAYVYFDSYFGSTKDTVKFAEGAFGTTNYIMTVEFGKNVPYYDNFGNIFDGGRLADVIIDSDNPNYYNDEGGAVYNNDGTKIIYYPRGKVGGYTLLETATEIGSNIFAGRVNLTYIEIGASVNTIGEGAFFGCTNLAKITVAEGNQNYCSDESGILYKLASGEGGVLVATELIYCPIACSVTEIEADENITKISDNAFYNNKTVKTVEFKASTSFELGANVFYGCSALETVVLPECLQTIPEYTFYNCSSLVSVNIPEGVTKIERYSFYGCSSLVGDLTDNTYGVTLSEGLVEVGEYAFYNDTKLAVTIPSTLQTIGNYSFYGCWNGSTTKVEIVFTSPQSGEGLGDAGKTYSMGNYAFANTGYATKVTIPGWFSTIGEGAFDGFGKGLIGSDSEPVVEFGSDFSLETLPSMMFAYAGINTITIPESVKTIESGAFEYCYDLGEVKYGSDGNTSNIEIFGEFSFSYTTSLTSICIPASVKDIGEGAFYCSNVANLTFAEGSQLEKIGDRMFEGYGDDGAKISGTVTIPKTVTYVGEGVFMGCVGLKEVVFEKRGEDGAELEFSRGVFNDCTGLEKVTLPDNMTSLGDSDGLFQGCTALKEISIPEKVETLVANSFSGCTSLGRVTFETNEDGKCSLKTIGDSSFKNCTSLTSFTFPETTAESITLGSEVFTESGVKNITLSSGVTDIGEAFRGVNGYTTFSLGTCTAYSVSSDGDILYDLTEGEIVYSISHLEGEYNIPEGITKIGNSAFYGQTGVTKITIPSSVTEVGTYAFYQCTSLETVTFENGESGNTMWNGTIGSYAFAECTLLKEITLPSGIQTIPERCFYQSDLSQTSLPGSLKYIGDHAFRGTKLTGEIDLESIETIGTYGFAEITTLTGVTFSENLISLGTYAFYKCTALNGVELPSSLTSISAYMFQGCTSLTSMEFSSSVTSIGSNVFQDCTALVSVILPPNITTLSSGLFYGCTSLSGVEIPAGVTEIASSSVFRNCYSITEITLPTGLTSLGSYAFAGCTSLESIIFPTQLKTINTYAFDGCSKLTTVTVTRNVSTLGNYSFRNCTSLEYAYTGDLITSIGTYMFYGCTSLRTVEFGAVVSSIGNYAFYNCSSLESISLSAALTSIGSYSFYSCTSLEYVLIPASVTTVSTQAFAYCTCAIYAQTTKYYVEEYGSNWNQYYSGTVYYFSQAEPELNVEGTDYEDNYWHYGENNEIIIWTLD